MIATREDLAGKFTGAGVELGVAGGAYSETILKRSDCAMLYSIDRWNDHHSPAQYLAVIRRLMPYRSRNLVLRLTFAEAAPLFLNAALDFVYIDGYAHTGQDNGETLRQWWPKLKPGGIFAGHDYHPTKWPLTVAAVDAFAASVAHRPQLTTEPAYPSWWMIRQA